MMMQDVFFEKCSKPLTLTRMNRIASKKRTRNLKTGENFLAGMTLNTKMDRMAISPNRTSPTTHK